jgi:hypothetical protein
MTVNNELERMWKKVIVALFEVISQCLSGGTEEDSLDCQVSQPKFELDTS